jgi:selenocysteine-specific elongation factor
MSHRPPGLLRVGENPDVVMMICTAGHVDHGKTRLVRLLTGCNTDRLKEEQERGMTIELGFAPCVLGGNLCVGIVDVPGHERFVRNMVAGVSGIDMAVLVVAADDGVMPQTIEHMQIMELLGVRRGIAALTKIDLVAGDLVPQRVEEVRRFLEGTFMSSAPICPVSSETGDGIFEFYDVLVNEIEHLAKAQRPGVFRMPVERSFAQKGFGVVVTGVPVSGAVHVDDFVELVPGHVSGRVRGIQRFLRDAAEGGYGQCLALNVPDFGKRVPDRGQVLCRPGYLQSGRCFHVLVKTVSDLNPPLRNAEQIKFHTGTAEQLGTVYLLKDKTLGKSQAAPATIIVSSPIPAAAHDRFIVRRPSPAATVCGGEILFVTQEAQRPRKKDILGRINEYAALLENVDRSGPEFLEKRLRYYLGVEKVYATTDAMSKATLHATEDVQKCLDGLAVCGVVLALDGGYYILNERYAGLLAQVKGHIQQARDNSVLSLTVTDLQRAYDLPAALWRRIRTDLETEGLASVQGDRLLLQGAVESLPETDRRLMEQILDLYQKTGFQSPRPDEVAGLLQSSADRTGRLFEFLCQNGRLVRVNRNVVLTADRLKQAQSLVVQTILGKGLLDSADFKYHIGSTRKYALAILDYLDARKVTVRIGNDRKLAANYEKNLLK